MRKIWKSENIFRKRRYHSYSKLFFTKLAQLLEEAEIERAFVQGPHNEITDSRDEEKYIICFGGNDVNAEESPRVLDNGRNRE